ncbi:MAG: molybdopterin-dependent oxidoreductase, partial [Candidatus Limnocylindria bacterium]
LGSRLPTARARGANVPRAARNLRSAVTVAPPDPAFEAIADLTPRLTDNRDHYTVDTALIDPIVDVDRWRLEVGGAVEAPFSLGYEELLDLESVEQLHTLECISNTVGGDLISTALWTGVPLRELLARARPGPAAFDVVLRSVDGYTDSIPIEKAREPTTLVAYLMNGVTLPEEHGFPARILVPNIYGMKNVKWVEKIEVVTFDFKGYWMERGWSDLATVNTNSRIDVPVREVRWSGGEVIVAGIAFAGSRGISSVELSTDDGATWSAAALEPALGPLTWRRWAFRWTPPATGTHVLRARSTDGTGRTETPVRTEPFPNGATGDHAIRLDVRRA